MNKRYTFLCIICLALFSSSLYAQEEEQDVCSQNLEEAQLRYDEGRIQDIEGLVLQCLNSGSYDKAQSVQAMRLLILSYIFTGDDGVADTTMFRLLRRSHEFTPDETLDPVEFINLHQTYRTWPIFRVGLKIGANMTTTEVFQLNTTGQPGDPGVFEYTPKQGITGGLVFEYEFAPRWNIYPEFYYSTKVLSNTEEFTTLTDGGILDVKEEIENQSWLEMPVSVQYRFIDGNIRPYVNLGGSINYLLSAQYPASQNSLVRQGNTIQNALGDVTDERNQLNFYAFLGGGVKIKISEGYLVAELRANYGLTDISTGDYGFSRSNTASDDQVPQRIAVDGFKQHFATFTLGYTLNIYKPKKL